MNTEYEIFKLLNGEYDRTVLPDLFSQMSYDSSLMNEFLNSLSLKLAPAGAIQFPSPSSNIKAEILKKINFQAEYKTKKKFLTAPFWINGSKYLLTALVASLITYFFMLQNYTGYRQADFQIKPATKNQVQNENPMGNKNVSGATNSGSNNSGLMLNEPDIEKQYHSITSSKFKSSESKPDVFNMVSNNGTSASYSSKSVIVSPSKEMLVSKDNTWFASLSKTDYKNFDMIPVIISNKSSDSKYGINLEIIMNEDWHIPSATITPEEFQAFNNSSIAISYSISDYLIIGADLRRENFYERYEGKDPLDKIYKKYAQTENCISYGIFVRNSFNVTDYFSPFIQSGISLGSTGPILRLGSGFAVYPIDNFGFTLSAEYSRLFFQHLGIDFYTEKAGLKIGIIKKF